MRLPGYDRNNDLVAAAPDGDVTAFAMCWLDPINKIGEFEPVGKRPAFRRRGLAQAVLAQGLRRMKAAGAVMAFVMAHSHEPGPVALYQSVGFHIANRDSDYIRVSQ